MFIKFFIALKLSYIKTFKKFDENCLWCPRWDSNPHGFPHDFESCASTNSATRAYCLPILSYSKEPVKTGSLFLSFYFIIFFLKEVPSNCSIFKISNIVADISANVERIPMSIPSFTCLPYTKIGTYSRS